MACINCNCEACQKHRHIMATYFDPRVCISFGAFESDNSLLWRNPAPHAAAPQCPSGNYRILNTAGGNYP